MIVDLFNNLLHVYHLSNVGRQIRGYSSTCSQFAVNNVSEAVCSVHRGVLSRAWECALSRHFSVAVPPPFRILLLTPLVSLPASSITAFFLKGVKLILCAVGEGCAGPVLPSPQLRSRVPSPCESNDAS